MPSTGIPLVELIREVTKMYSQLGSLRPIVVHCSSGVGRTGVFIALNIILERMKLEGVVDVFQTVKMLRIQRPAMVQTLVSHVERLGLVTWPDHPPSTLLFPRSSTSSAMTPL